MTIELNHMSYMDWVKVNPIATDKCDELKKGRELNVAVARDVMEWPEYLWTAMDFGEDIRAAWMVVEKITEPPHDIETAKRMPNTKFGYWFDNANLWAMSASEAAEAICRAALMAAEAE